MQRRSRIDRSIGWITDLKPLRDRRRYAAIGSNPADNNVGEEL